MRQILLCLMFSLTSYLAPSFAGHLPFVTFANLTPNEHTVFFGERKIIQIKMSYGFLKFNQEWIFPRNVAVLNFSGLCPPFGSSPIDWPFVGACYFNLVISGDELGRVISGYRMFHLYGRQANLGSWDIFPTIDFALTVIPHPLSLATIPHIEATANVPFFLNLGTYVNYYYENVLANASPVFEVAPAEQDGLYYDPTRFALVGQPKRLGTYQFSIAARNQYGRAAPTLLTVEVKANLKDKPIFKEQVSVRTALPGQLYQQNLLELIETPNSDPHNPLYFQLDKSNSYPDWLEISGVNHHDLQGIVPLYEAGKEQEVTLIAISNTGGASKPLKLPIPIAYDSASKAIINPFFLEKVAGNAFQYDVKKHIQDPVDDPELHLIIDKVEPAVSWLKISPYNPTVLIGTVPRDVHGHEYVLTLHVKTRRGGDSDPVVVRLKIAVNKEKTPRFKAANPQLPLVYTGQPFFHDFVHNRDVFPDYEEAPYQIEFAKGFRNPSWLHLEDNKLSADLVPSLDEPLQEIHLIIKNIPGGQSEVITLTLFVMDEK